MKGRTKNLWQKLFNVPFLRKNFRNMRFEEQIIFLAQLVTLLGCFLPWVSVKPTVFGQPYYYTAFSGTTSVLGFFVFFMSSIVTVFFLEKIWQKKWIKIPIKTQTILHSANIQSLILLVSAWSVFMQIEKATSVVSTSFGWFLCFFAQIATIVAHFLATQNYKKQTVEDFFINKQSNEQ
ncbi:hypothetical protein CSB37_01425 [bacterium DOLZORAL124_38_8]|nr:MAG: hypothetical protein CSB37_01425 [bacterium DOLZORAL124_38_8]